MAEIVAMIPRRNPRERLRIAREVFRNVERIDLRIAIKLNDATELYTPTKCGVGFDPEQLPHVIAALQQLQADREGA